MWLAIDDAEPVRVYLAAYLDELRKDAGGVVLVLRYGYPAMAMAGVRTHQRDYVVAGPQDGFAGFHWPERQYLWLTDFRRHYREYVVAYQRGELTGQVLLLARNARPRAALMPFAPAHSWAASEHTEAWMQCWETHRARAGVEHNPSTNWQSKLWSSA